MGLRLLTAAALIVAIAAGAGPPQVEAGAPATLLVYSLDGWIWRADVDGSDRVRVARGLHPEISPDGRWVAFLRRTRARDVHELRVAALDGRTRKLVRRGRVWSYAWLPDSTRLLIHDADAGVLLSHRRGGPATRLARHRVEDGGTINAVSIAPDAPLVVFDRSDRRGIDLFAVPVAGGAERRLTVDGNSHAPLAGPTATAFTRLVGGRRAHEELWLMDADGTNQRRLSQTVSRPALWSADGSRLLAVNLGLTLSGGWFGDLWSLDLPTGAARSLYKRPIEGLQAAGLSRDGSRVLAVRGCVSWGTAGKPTPGRIETIPAQGGKPRILLRGPCFASWNA